MPTHHVLAGDVGGGSLALHGGEEPVLHRACVEHGLCRGKGLADDDDQGLLGVKPARRPHNQKEPERNTLVKK